MNQELPPSLETWLLAYIADSLSPNKVEEWVVRTSAAIKREIPDLAMHPDLLPALKQGVRAQWMAFLSALAQDALDFELVEAAARVAREMAVLDFPLETLIKVYRSAQQESWTYVTGVVNGIPTDAADSAAVLIYFWGRAGAWIDASIDASIEVFQDERTRRMRGETAHKFEVVKDLLSGKVLDARQSSRALGGYPISVVHTALIFETSASENVTELDKVAHDLARSVDSCPPLLIHPGGHQLWAWLGTRGMPGMDAFSEYEESLRRLSARLYVGCPAPSADGLVTSHRDAERAQAVADEGGPWAYVMRFDEVELAGLLGCSPEVDRFVRRTLAGMHDDDGATERLRSTVASYLRHGGSVEEAAAELCVHRNTVRYRLGRAEELLERPVSRAGDQLLLAIQHLTLFHSRGRAGHP